MGILAMAGCYMVFVIYRSVTKYPAYRTWKHGVELAAQHQWKPAIRSYGRALERLGKKGELEYHLGSSMVFEGQYSRAIYYLNRAKEDFNDRNINLSESLAHIKLENYEEAERLALKALAMFPTHLAPHLLLGEIYYEQGRFEESKASLRKCIIMETPIISPEVKQIQQDAKEFWRQKYGGLLLNKETREPM